MSEYTCCPIIANLLYALKRFLLCTLFKVELTYYKILVNIGG